VGSKLSSLPVYEGCLGASDVWCSAKNGSSSGAEPTPPMRTLADSVVALPLGKDWEGSLGASDVKDRSSSKAALLTELELTPLVSSQATSEVAYPLGRDREDHVLSLELKEAQAESVRNSAMAMGLLRRGFLGPRSPSLSFFSLGCKAAPVKAKGNSASENGLIRRGFFGSSSTSPMIPMVSQVCSSPSAASISSMSMSQLAYSQRVKEKAVA
jgi:hypothetical protein